MSKIVGFFTKGFLFVISLVLSLLTIALAWFAYRPILSIGILVVIGGILYAFKDKLPKFNKKEQVEQTVSENTEQV